MSTKAIEGPGKVTEASPHRPYDPFAIEPAIEPAIDTAYETLVQFLYRAPVGLVQAALDGTVEMMNPMGVNLLMTASPDRDLDNLFDALGALAPGLREQVQQCAFASGVVCDSLRVEVPASPARGTARQVLSINLSKLDGTRLMAMVADVTLELQREESGLAARLDAAARVDPLTQLPNRAVMCERIERAIARGLADPARAFTVLFVNCDRFKQINDTLGRRAGDAVLGLMADRLRSALCQRAVGCAIDDGAMVARLGGDEFAMFLDDIVSPYEADAVATHLRDVLAQPYVVDAYPLHASVSIGVVLRAGATSDADQVLRDASIAMVEAKRAGGARHVLFEAAMHERTRLRGGVEADLRRALGKGELFVVYQPVVTFESSAQDVAGAGLSSSARSAGVEALVRWNHPVRGLVSPIEFIGIAEQCGLICALGEFVLATACRQFMDWQRTLGARAPRLLAVNVSRGQLVEPGFAGYVAGVLQACGMSPAQLQLEITESLAAQDEAIQRRLHELKALGLTLALDDFGTGYSSLASLHALPVDTVKIDRSFVSEAVSSTYHRVLIEATIRVAASLRMNTVAEGIETDAQATLLRELGCQKGQGYLFGRPLDAVALVDWLTTD